VSGGKLTVEEGRVIEHAQYLLGDAFRSGSFTIYLLMLAGGILASVTPCTYPVLPVTVAYVGNQAGANRLRAFLLSLSLVIGLGTVYAVMGAIVAALGGSVGSIMGNGAVLFSIALFYLIMGLFLLDVFQLPTPAFFSGLQTKSANLSGVFGSFVIGCVSGLIVGPCTGPILAIALAAIALTLENAQGVDYALQIVRGGVLLFLFGFGQGALILVAGTFTGFLLRLPKAGRWMETVKKGTALLIILTASLLFVMVGQNTNFPNLIRLMAGAYSSSPAPVSMPAGGGELPPLAAETRSDDMAPDFRLTSLQGKQVTLSQFRGKKGVVLVFFATWCVNCVKEIPDIKKFAEEAKKKNIVVVAIDYKQPADIVERLVNSEQINYEVLLDADGTVTAEKYGIRGLPHIVGVDPKGALIYRGIDIPQNRVEFMGKLTKGL
jgi:cytochrome c-type biogenesis protein